MSRKQKWQAIALAALSGVLYFVGFIGFDQWYLAWICLAPLLLGLRLVQTAKGAFFLSWWMGFATFLGGYYWLIHLFQTFASLPLPVACLGYALFCLGQGFQFAVCGWIVWRVHRRTGISMGWAAPLALMACEFTVPLFFASYLANSQAWTPQLTQIADLGGVLLLSGVMALFSGALFEVIAARLDHRPFPRAIALTAAALLLFDVGYSQLRIHQMEARDAAAPKLKTAIIQGNVGAGDKHLSNASGIARFRAMSDAAMSAHPDLDLVVWPESAFNRVVREDTNMTGLVARDLRVPMLVGVLRAARSEGGRRLWNSVAAVAPGGAIQAFYDKVELLAFGEYVPGESLLGPIYERLLPFTSSFERGERLDPLPVGPWRLSANVCYEDILPRHIRQLMGVSDEAGNRPHAMVNVTNDSWYGPAEPPIHLALSTFRAIEHRRWMVRATATGLSAFIDASGRLRQQSGFETAETLIEDVPMIADGPTVYGLFGDWAGWLSLASVLALLFWRKTPAANTRTASEAPQAPSGRVAV